MRFAGLVKFADLKFRRTVSDKIVMAVCNGKRRYKERAFFFHEIGGFLLHMISVLNTVAAQFDKLLDRFVAAEMGGNSLAGAVSDVDDGLNFFVGHLFVRHSFMCARGAAGKTDFNKLRSLGNLRTGSRAELIRTVIHC